LTPSCGYVPQYVEHYVTTEVATSRFIQFSYETGEVKKK